jgi:hypothetical protein
MDKMQEAISWISEMAKAAKKNDESKTSNIIQLPLWPETVRAVPNGMLRSALFGAIKKGTRRYIEGEQVAAVDGVSIRYTGQRLDQGDLDVWESVLHVARVQEMGEQCRFTAYGLLKLMGKTDSGSNREVLHKRLMRLKANALEIQQGQYRYAGSLIDDVYRDDSTHEYVLIVNPKLSPLFVADQFTQVQWAVRNQLSGKPLAQWLHGFYATHAKPYPMKIETLHALCGSEAKRVSDFKIDLRRNLDALSVASKAQSETFSYEIIGDLVHVERKPSKAQKRHLTDKTRP